MLLRNELRSKLFSVTESSFQETALEILRYQFHHNEVYHQYCSLLETEVNEITSLDQIPFLPIELFKTHRIKTGNFSAQKIFTSSGTTGQKPSKHYVTDLKLYEESFLKGFESFFGNPAEYCLLALLPSYLGRDDSSLVYMVDALIKKTNHPRSGFFLDNHDELYKIILSLEEAQQKTLLIGVSFALLDFAEKFSMQLKHTLVMETGGMKGRREELTREQLHHQLKKSLGVKNILSEYGMTELLSQAYFLADEKFHCPPWMKILIRDVNDPMQITGNNLTGAINIIDLANIDSCSFIATSDLGKQNEDGNFEVLGRMDYSDVRGCNLIIE